MELVLCEASGREIGRVWPEADALPPGAVQETRTYIFELRPVSLTPPLPELLLDGEALLRDIPAAGRICWRWPVGFNAGEIELELRLGPGRREMFCFVVDPDRRKLTREHFRVMVREILEDTFALLSLSDFRIGVARGAGSSPPIARLEFLHAVLSELELVVRTIAARPVRFLQAEERQVRPHQAREITPTELLRSFVGPGLVREGGEGPSRLPPALQGNFPGILRKRVKVAAADLREHRAIKHALRSWAQWLAAVGGSAGRVR